MRLTLNRCGRRINEQEIETPLEMGLPAFPSAHWNPMMEPGKLGAGPMRGP